MNLRGIPIIADANLYEEERRTWRERLFTRPWQPRKRYKRVPMMVELRPDTAGIIKRHVIVAHPDLIKILAEEYGGK